MYIYIYINTYVYFFSFPPFISRFLFSTVSAPIYDLNCSTLQTARSLQPQKHARCVWPRCGALLSLSPRHRSFPNLMFFSSLPEKRESFPRFSPPPPFISHRSSHAKDSTVFLIFSISFIFPFSESLDLKEEKKIVAKSFPSFFFSKFFLTQISIFPIQIGIFLIAQIQQRSIPYIIM